MTARKQLCCYVFFNGEAYRRCWTRRNRCFRLIDAAQKNRAEPAGCFIIQTEVGVLFHHMQCVSKLVHKIGIVSRIQHNFIVPSWCLGSSIDFPGRFCTSFAS